MDTAWSFAEGLGRMFYAVNPATTTFASVEDVPKYVSEATPFFVSFIILERLIMYMKGRKAPHINDSVTSVSNGIVMEVSKILFNGMEHVVYFYIYERWGKNNLELPWDSSWTWILAAVGMDLGYYWAHRAGHEISLFWAAHQVHHSSEHYDLTTALRQSVFQSACSWMFYIPMAFFIPPSHFLAHASFNLLYQFWIHTELIDNLGPLEFVLNTPSHHRVHHGANKYCLDKNYAGVLIVWDRMFGTFAPERSEEKPVYGLVTPNQSFNPIQNQIFYYRDIFEKASKMDTWGDRLSAILKGPGWSKGTGWLGDPSTFPDVGLREKFNVKIPAWQTYYGLVHFVMMIYAYDLFAKHLDVLTIIQILAVSFYVIFSLTSIGLLYDNHPAASFLEVIRSVASLLITNGNTFGVHTTVMSALRVYFFISALTWAVIIQRNMAVSNKKKL